MKTIYFDVETGGVKPEQPTIQLAAVVVDEGWKEIAVFEQKIRFDVAACDPEALKLNHYTEEAWKDAVVPSLAASKFATFVKPHSDVVMTSKRTGAPYNVARLAGYNAVTFDLPRLRELFGQQFFPCSYHVRDVLQRAMFWFDENPEASRPDSLKLSCLCEYFEINSEGAHDALTDVRLTASLAKRFASGGWK